MNTIALLGQPNSGKSTMFNQLTGSRQHVGNWPGKTVEKKYGTFQIGGTKYIRKGMRIWSASSWTLPSLSEACICLQILPQLIFLLFSSST